MLVAVITILAVLVSVWDKLAGIDFSHLSVLFAVLAGAFVGVQRALNGQINEYSQESYATSLLNFITGTSFLILFIAALVITGRNELQPLPAGPWWIYTGGVIGVIYIAFTSTIVQHLGVLTFTMFSVGGNLLGSLLIDIFSPSEAVHISWYLVGGIVMTYVGVLINGASLQSKKPHRPSNN